MDDWEPPGTTPPGPSHHGSADDLPALGANGQADGAANGGAPSFSFNGPAKAKPAPGGAPPAPRAARRGNSAAPAAAPACPQIWISRDHPSDHPHLAPPDPTPGGGLKRQASNESFNSLTLAVRAMTRFGPSSRVGLDAMAHADSTQRLWQGAAAAARGPRARATGGEGGRAASARGRGLPGPTPGRTSSCCPLQRPRTHSPPRPSSPPHPPKPSTLTPPLGNPYISKVEAIASAAVRAADKVQASLIIVYTHTGARAAPCITPHPQTPPPRHGLSGPGGGDGGVLSGGATRVGPPRCPPPLTQSPAPPCSAGTPPALPPGRTAQLVAKYRPPMPILTLVVPRLVSDTLHWRLEGK